jgi:hypothetical protein
MGGVDTDANGIPLKSSYPAGMPVLMLYTIFTGVFMGIGCSVAYFGVYVRNAAAADAKIAVIASGGFGWIYAGAFALKLGQFFMGVNLGTARKESKVNVPDQQVRLSLAGRPCETVPNQRSPLTVGDPCFGSRSTMSRVPAAPSLGTS